MLDFTPTLNNGTNVCATLITLYLSSAHVDQND